MLKKVKKIFIQLMIGANLMTIFLLLVCSLSTYLHPTDYPYLAVLGLGFPAFLLANILFLFFWLVFYIKNIWIPLVGFVLNFAFIRDYCPVNWPSEPPSGSLKVLTYNIEAFGHDSVDAHGKSVVLNYILDADADIVCLQESSPTGGMTLSQLDSTMKSRGYYIPERANCDPEHRFLCYAKLPFIDCEEISYESETNGSIAYRLLDEQDTILLVNNHFESVKLTVKDKTQYKEMIKDPERDKVKSGGRLLMRKLSRAFAIRGPEVDSVMNYIQKSKCKSVIVCGDFNDSPISYTYRALTEHLTSAFEQSGNGLGLSYNQKGFYVRIDHILFSNAWKSYGTKVDNSFAASDHYPLITYLKRSKKQESP